MTGRLIRHEYRFAGLQPDQRARIEDTLMQVGRQFVEEQISALSLHDALSGIVWALACTRPVIDASSQIHMASRKAVSRSSEPQSEYQCCARSNPFLC